MPHHSSSVGIIVGVLVLTIGVLVVVSLVGRRRGYSGLGGNTIVRCRQGHLFTSIWVPGASIKAVRLGWVRFQYCPVGTHWTLVKPVKESTLSEDERRQAAEVRDLRIP
ncbi:MAG TPA: hypothetical protein VMV96_03140 [Acidimicrobiales bacterium]|nr:hypothetical protein [Acidimicrobiales bacterium]